MVILGAMAAMIEGEEISFDEDDGVIPNPERGFYLYQSLSDPGDQVATMRDRNQTLLWGKIDLEPYRETEVLPGTFLEKLEKGFETAQNSGVKVIVRASYGWKGPDGTYKTYRDPEMAVMRGHIEQLAPVFERNADRIAFFEAGFLGPWGEWHTTEVARSPEKRRELFFHLLDHTPKNRMVVVRYPALKQSLFETSEPLTRETASDGSRRARTGHHNDCFLSSANDVGTYNRESLSMKQEQAYLAKDTLHTLFGGESCGLHDRSLPNNAIPEMERLHLSYLNASYHPEVLQRWRDLDVMDTIEKRMGARIVLESMVVPDGGVSGKETVLKFTLVNRGFAALYNERRIVPVLRSKDGESVHRFPLEVDMRDWKPGVCVDLAARITLPEEIEAGDYSWDLHFPDVSPRLREDPRFAYRLANQGIWNSTTGEHRLVEDWPVRNP